MPLVYNRKTNRLENVQPAITEKPTIKPKIIFGLVFLFAGYGIFSFFSKPGKILIENKKDPSQGQEQAIEIQKAEAKATGKKVENHKISEGDLPADIFSKIGKLNANDTAALIVSADGVHDFANLKIGREIRFYFGEGEKAERIEYEKDTERIVIAERDGAGFKVREEKINYEVFEEVAKGKIDNFFYVDALEAGLSEPTVLEVGDLFSFSIDFSTEIRQGDEFAFVYEKRKRDGSDAPDGRILAAKFINDGTTNYAYYFEGGYYDGEGRVLERQFLRAPLSYRAITSGYTGARRHPITRTVTAHYQIDYAAPTGTPVSSTARGTVISAGWEGGWGNIVRIRHDNGYTTHYGHLSGYGKGIKSGASVSQGQVIGFVGSTGWSTGPHLDYGMKLNGSPVNPLKLDLPKGNPLEGEKLAQFEDNKKKFLERL